MEGNNHNGMCNCPHHKFMPILIVLFGLTFLLGAMGTITMGTVNIVWPIIIIVAGLFKLNRGMCKCCTNG